MNYSECSDGAMVSQATIKRNLSESYREKYWNISSAVCECCQSEMSVDSDHTIAQARCKEIHKTELIWNPGNYVRSCRVCHKQWENFKSGDWLLHKNVIERLAFMQEYDPEGYTIRVELTEFELNKEQ